MTNPMSPHVGKKIRIRMVHSAEFMPRRLASRLTYAVRKMKLAKKMLANVTRPAKANEASTGWSRSSGGNMSFPYGL